MFCCLVRTQRVRCSELIEAQANRDTMACFSAKVQDRRVIAEVHTSCTAMGFDATKNTTQIPRPAGKTSCTLTRLLSSVTSAIWYPPTSPFQFGCDAHTLQGFAPNGVGSRYMLVWSQEALARMWISLFVLSCLSHRTHRVQN